MGCNKTPKCRNCWNPQSWCFDGGYKFTGETKKEILNSLKPNYIKGLSILGGEPCDNLFDEVLIDLVKTVKETYPNKTIYVWSGYTYEELIIREECKKFFNYIDMLRDGEYIDELKDLNQYLQGSTNQRYIDVKKSLIKNEIVEYLFEN